MKVLFVCSAREWGGNEKWSSMAIKELQDQGHRVRIALRNPLLAKKFGSNLKWTFAPFLTALDPFSLIIGFFTMLFYRPDVVVSTKKAEYFTFGVLTRLFRTRHILRLGIVRDLDSPWKKFVYTKLNEGIIVNAQRTKDNFKKYDFVNLDKIHLIYNGIPLIETKTPYQVHDPFTLISVGTLTPRKGVHLVIEAIATLPEALQKKISYQVIGTGLQKKELESLIKKYHLEEQVSLLGFSSQPQMYLEQADLFVLISENEGISNALLEAMMLGIPGLTTKSGGTAEFMVDKKNGFLVERGVQEVSDYLKWILNHKEELKAIGLAGQKEVKSFFSLKRMGQQVEALLKGEC